MSTLIKFNHQVDMKFCQRFAKFIIILEIPNASQTKTVINRNTLHQYSPCFKKVKNSVITNNCNQPVAQKQYISSIKYLESYPNSVDSEFKEKMAKSAKKKPEKAEEEITPPVATEDEVSEKKVKPSAKEKPPKKGKAKEEKETTDEVIKEVTQKNKKTATKEKPKRGKAEEEKVTAEDEKVTAEDEIKEEIKEEAPPKEKKTTAKAAANKKTKTKPSEELPAKSENGTIKKKETKAKKAQPKAKKSEEKEAPGTSKQESAPPSAPPKAKRARRGNNEEAAEETEEKPSEAPVKKNQKRKASKTDDNEPDLKKEKGTTRMNATSTPWETIDFGCTTKNSQGQTPNFHITSWNVDGIRAWLKKGGLDILKYDQPDILCLQETKCSEDKLPDEVKTIEGYETFWCGSDKEGYAGVGVISKTKPINVTYGIDAEEHDDEGRCITAEYEKFYLVNVYVPNAGRKLVTLPKRLEWNEAFKTYIKTLDKNKPVILCGDMNVAHNEIDLANPKTNTKNAGFTPEEREGMTDFLGDGYVDTFRQLYPEKENAYTFWTYMSNARSKNVGWRLDYFIVSERMMENVCDNIIHSEVLGSDHCPLTLHVNL